MPQPITAEQILNGDFFELIGLSSVSDTDKRAMLESMNQTVQARVYLRVLETAGPEKAKIIDTLPVEEYLPYLEDNGFDMPALILEEALKYRLELATVFQASITPRTTS